MSTIKRRTQAERSAETRAKLCIAALDTLAQVGYSRFSTEDVARRAQVSRGALTHQFPSRNALILAAFEHLHKSWESTWPFTGPDGIPHLRVNELIDALWEKLFLEQHYIAAIELMLAARIDDELGNGVRDIMLRWVKRRDTIIAHILGLPEDDPRVHDLARLNLCVMRGLAVHRSFDHQPGTDTQVLEIWKRLLAPHVQTRDETEAHGDSLPPRRRQRG